jgi:hypothetical protein
VSVPDQPCTNIAGPSIIVASFTDALDCYGNPSPGAPVITLANGGPPNSPIPTRAPTPQTISGIAFEVAAVDDEPLDQQVVLATFPDFDAWLRLDATGGTLDQARNEAQRVLDTVRSEPVADATQVPTESFTGHWTVHDATLDINGDGRGTIDGYGGGSVVEEDTLALTLSSDGRRLDAVVAAVQYFDSTGNPTATDPSGSTAVGDTSYFEFVAPDLLKETYVTTSRAAADVDYGNPYWCGESLDRVYGYACGA